MSNVIQTNGMVTFQGLNATVPYIRVNLTNRAKGKQYKQICYTQDELEYVYLRHATPGDIFYGCEIEVIRCTPEKAAATA